MRSVATMTAMMREITYPQFTPTSRLLWLRIPPIGTLLLVLAHLVFVTVLEFINNDVHGAQFWQARGVRAGWLAIAQVPLLIILTMKNNIVTVLTGVSYERLNTLHRWTARIMLFMAILHFGYQSYGWQQFGLMRLEWKMDDCPTTGIAAFALLLWINLSTLAPFRHWSYEFFVLQHILTFFGFIVAILMHLPSTALWSRIYVYIPIALYLLDRLCRTATFFISNIPVRKATLTALDGGVTKIRLSNKSIKTWDPGSFVLLSIPTFGWVESHPATMMSNPASHNGDMIFLLKSQRGFTKRIMESAHSSTIALLPYSKEESQVEENRQAMSYRASINGPYGGSQSDFAAFDSVGLLAGSTGVTFTLALLQDLAARAALGQEKLVVRRVHFIWCVKDANCTSWCNDEIISAKGKLESAGIELEISIYVTCADAFTEQGAESKECGCSCDKSLGPCCCIAVDVEHVKAPVTDPKSLTSKEKKTAAFVSTSPAESTQPLATQLSILPGASFYSGRPDIQRTVSELLENANGESGIGLCGPIGMSSMVRNTVVKLSDERAIHKGSGAQGCYLHVENFS